MKKEMMFALLAVTVPWAQAHITLEQKQAPVGSYYKALVQVPHGCAGSATTAIRVQIPEGVMGAKPQPKPGWKLTIKRAKLAQATSNAHGHQQTDRVVEIAWTGGSLKDEEFDEFRIVMRLPDTSGKLYFPVIQECKVGEARWVGVPTADQLPGELDFPAPVLELQAR